MVLWLTAREDSPRERGAAEPQNQTSNIERRTLNIEYKELHKIFSEKQEMR